MIDNVANPTQESTALVVPATRRTRFSCRLGRERSHGENSGVGGPTHGVVGLSRNAALEYASSGVRVNSVGPAFIQTPLLEKNLDDEMLAALSGMHPIQRLGTSEEVANLVGFLCSDGASFCTGGYYLVDGGYTAQ